MPWAQPPPPPFSLLLPDTLLVLLITEHSLRVCYVRLHKRWHRRTLFCPQFSKEYALATFPFSSVWSVGGGVAHGTEGTLLPLRGTLFRQHHQGGARALPSGAPGPRAASQPRVETSPPEPHPGVGAPGEVLVALSAWSRSDP